MFNSRLQLFYCFGATVANNNTFNTMLNDVRLNQEIAFELRIKCDRPLGI